MSGEQRLLAGPSVSLAAICQQRNSLCNDRKRVVLVLSFVSQGNDPSGTALMAKPVERNFSTAANGPGITTPSGQSARPSGK